VGWIFIVPAHSNNSPRIDMFAFYSASALKQQSADRHIVPLRHIILIASQPVFAFSP